MPSKLINRNTRLVSSVAAVPPGGRAPKLIITLAGNGVRQRRRRWRRRQLSESTCRCISVAAANARSRHTHTHTSTLHYTDVCRCWWWNASGFPVRVNFVTRHLIARCARCATTLHIRERARAPERVKCTSSSSMCHLVLLRSLLLPEREREGGREIGVSVFTLERFVGMHTTFNHMYSCNHPEYLMPPPWKFLFCTGMFT